MLYSPVAQEKQQAFSIVDSLRLLCIPGNVYELRIPKTAKGTICGYFTDLEKMAAYANHYSGSVPGVYFTLNPVADNYLGLANNRVKEYAKNTTPDSAVVKRCLLLVDADPRRDSKEISSSDPEHAAAVERARQIRTFLDAAGFPEPVFADSGDGGHLLYGLDLPNDEPSRQLIEGS